MNTPITFTGIIPARYASSRFPGKPLVFIGDKQMIRLVYEQASKALSNVFVATDDERIYNAVTEFGGKVVMTATTHRSGTDRCAEAIEIIEKSSGKTDVVINIQGDEPFIKPSQITSLMGCFDDPLVDIATLVRKVNPGEDLINPNQPKVVLSVNGYAIYFSRSVIPYFRDDEMNNWSLRHTYYKHIGLYAYKTSILKKITSLPHGRLEDAESLEQNRWLENGYRIKTAVTEWESIGIDTPEDLKKAKEIIDRI